MDDSISRQDALKTVGLIKSKHDKTSVFSDDFDVISRTETMIAISNLPSADPDVAEKLHRFKCCITDKKGFQHEVIYIDDIRRVTGWEI